MCLSVIDNRGVGKRQRREKRRCWSRVKIAIMGQEILAKIQPINFDQFAIP